MPAFIIQTFTASYDPYEDRVRLAVVNEQGDAQTIWLTRRLLDRLLAALVKSVEEQNPAGVPLEVAQTMQQEQMRQARQLAGEPKPVTPTEGAPGWLCTTVHLNKLEDGITLIMTDNHNTEATLQLSAVNLRAVLDVLLTVYRAAEWGLAVFPAWMKAEVQPDVRCARLN